MTIQTRPGRFRHTVILTATGNGLERFESLDAMPPVLRAKCLRALEGRASGTVVIAGQAEAERGQAQGDAAPAAAATEEAAAPPAGRSRERWMAFGLLLAVLAAVACFLLWRS